MFFLIYFWSLYFFIFVVVVHIHLCLFYFMHQYVDGSIQNNTGKAGMKASLNFFYCY